MSKFEPAPIVKKNYYVLFLCITKNLLIQLKFLEQKKIFAFPPILSHV